MNPELKKDMFKDEILPDLKMAAEKLKREKEFDKAINILEKALKMNPENFWIKGQIALCAFYGKNPDPSMILDCLDSIKIYTFKGSPPEKRILKSLILLCFSLKEYEEAKNLIKKLEKYGLGNREKDDLLYRLMGEAIAHKTDFPGPEKESFHPAWQAVYELMGDDGPKALTAFANKAGLALSGGGFRASFYHLGVLARLAELDALKDIEVLSTVSGGSIVGALYYLKIKELLETKKDSEITKKDYIRIVRQIQDDFHNGVKKNIRTLAFSDFTENMKMIISKKYSRSHRLGHLYEALLYDNVSHEHQKGAPRYMNELLIRPKGEEARFKPRNSNWRRKAKVPILILNATSLNSGHSWHFTASFMGEPPGLLLNKKDKKRVLEVDKNARYRRVRYELAPEEFKKYRLGYAVAASACVPGLFEPLPLEELYPDTIVRLVDGGVHDNQGVSGLLDENCRFIFCSDASGQMHDVNTPKDTISSVLMRASSVTMDRVREEQYEELRAKLMAKELSGLFFVHLKKDFPSATHDWTGCEHTSHGVNENMILPYGITLKIQKKISEIRTDLDSFSDVEAFSLMASGYLMSGQEAKAIQKRVDRSGENRKWGEYDVNVPVEKIDDEKELWPFLALKNALSGKESQFILNDLEKQLKVASFKALRIWKLENSLKYTAITAGIFLFILIAKCIKANYGKEISFTIGAMTDFFIILAVPVIIGVIFKALFSWMSKFSKIPLTSASSFQNILNKITKWMFVRKAARNIAKDILIALAGSVLFSIHIKIFDKMFLKRGSIKKLLR